MSTAPQMNSLSVAIIVQTDATVYRMLQRLLNLAPFAGDPAKQAQWQAFLKRNSLDAPELQLGQVIGGLRDFLLPPLALSAKDHFSRHWSPGGPWT